MKRSGFPRFKKPNRMRSFLFPQMLKDCVSDEGIKLPQVRLVKVRWSREIPELFQVKQARIARKASGYFVMLSLQADIDISSTVPHGHPVGVDVGLEYFLSTSDGEQVKRPRFFNDLHRKLKLLQRRLKKKQKGSTNWLKLQKKMARVHERIADTRKDWHFKLAHHLCNGAGMVFVEDLNFRISESSQHHTGVVTALRHGIDLGLTLIDTAEMYGEGGAEIVVGDAIAAHQESAHQRS